MKQLKEKAQQTIDLAQRVGADAAEVIIREGADLTVKVRLGEPELVKEAQSAALGLRVFVDRRTAITHTNDLSPSALAQFVVDTVTLARLAEPDEYNFLPNREELTTYIPDLDLWDEATTTVGVGQALDWVKRAEKAARTFDARITNSEGATWSRALGTVVFAQSDGFVGGYRGTYQGLHVEPVCDDQGGKKRNGHHFTGSRFLKDLEDPEAVGVEAARRTVAQLGARKIKSCRAPVVFDREAGRALLADFVAVANGAAFYRRSSYLLDKENQPVASSLVTLVDDPLIPRGVGSRPFDGDGLASQVNVVVDQGVLRTILCDTYSARRLGRSSTGSAGRGIGGAPSPSVSNFYLKSGMLTPEAIVRDVRAGLYVTEMMGFGFNTVTGDFSRGASGFWIVNGERAFPVSEVTISANFKDLWCGVDAVANDLDVRSAIRCPTFRVSSMTVAGQ